MLDRARLRWVVDLWPSSRGPSIVGGPFHEETWFWAWLGCSRGWNIASGRGHSRRIGRAPLECVSRMRGHNSSNMRICAPAVPLVGLHVVPSGYYDCLHGKEQGSSSVAVGRGLSLQHRGVSCLSTNSKGHEVTASLGKREKGKPRIG